MGDFIHFILHTNDYLQDWVIHYGALVYLFLFLIVFSETGLVVTPFLPGDGLVFTVGVIAGTTGALNIWISILLLSLAAILGNAINYHIGRFLSVRILEGGKIRWVNQKYIDQTHEFFEKHGQKAVILSRFLPVFRTFVPFVAGISKMNRGKFLNYTILGGVAWVTSFGMAGYFFGQIDFVKNNLSFIVMALIVITIIPVITTALKHRIKAKKPEAESEN